MKTIALAFLSLAILGTGALAQAPVGPTSIKVGRVEVSAPSTPEYQITGGQNKRYKTAKWLEFEVGYETKVDEIDELTFAFSALIENKLLDGEVTYVNIAKGPDHFAVMYISPKSIDKLTQGKTLTASSIQNVWVEVRYKGQLIGKESYKPGNPPNVQRVPGMVVNKTMTPFAPLFYDRYEEIKANR